MYSPVTFSFWERDPTTSNSGYTVRALTFQAYTFKLLIYITTDINQYIIGFTCLTSSTNYEGCLKGITLSSSYAFPAEVDELSIMKITQDTHEMPEKLNKKSENQEVEELLDEENIITCTGKLPELWNPLII